MAANPRALLVTAMAALLLAAGACGKDDVPSESQASSTVRELARDTAGLAGEVAKTGRSIVAGSDSEEQITTRLKQQEQRARELADRVERDLPEEQQARQTLREANERTADAARELRRFARGGDRDALQRARDELSSSEDRLQRAADELQQSLPENAQDAIDDLRRQVPEIPGS